MQQVKITILADVGEKIEDQSRAGLAKMVDKAFRESGQVVAVSENKYFTTDSDLLIARSIDVEFVIAATKSAAIQATAPVAATDRREIEISFRATVGKDSPCQLPSEITAELKKMIAEDYCFANHGDGRITHPDSAIIVDDIAVRDAPKAAVPATPAFPVTVAPVAVSPNVGLTGNVEIHLSASIGSTVDPSRRTVEGITKVVRDAVLESSEAFGMIEQFNPEFDSEFIAVHKITVSGNGYTSHGEPVRIDQSIPVEDVTAAPAAPTPPQLPVVKMPTAVKFFVGRGLAPSICRDRAIQVLRQTLEISGVLDRSNEHLDRQKLITYSRIAHEVQFCIAHIQETMDSIELTFDFEACFETYSSSNVSNTVDLLHTIIRESLVSKFAKDSKGTRLVTLGTTVDNPSNTCFLDSIVTCVEHQKPTLTTPDFVVKSIFPVSKPAAPSPAPAAPQVDARDAVHDKVGLHLSRPALDRMIGGDSEIEVKLRQSIVEDFCNRKLKSLINQESIQKACAEIEHKLHEAVEKVAYPIFSEIFGRGWSWGAEIKFPPRVTDKIQEEVYKMLGIEIVATTKNVLDSVDIAAMIDEKVNASVRSRINAGVTARISRIIDSVGGNSE